MFSTFESVDQNLHGVAFKSRQLISAAVLCTICSTRLQLRWLCWRTVHEMIQMKASERYVPVILVLCCSECGSTFKKRSKMVTIQLILFSGRFLWLVSVELCEILSTLHLSLSSRERRFCLLFLWSSRHSDIRWVGLGSLRADTIFINSPLLRYYFEILNVDIRSTEITTILEKLAVFLFGALRLSISLDYAIRWNMNPCLIFFVFDEFLSESSKRNVERLLLCVTPL